MLKYPNGFLYRYISDNSKFMEAYEIFKWLAPFRTYLKETPGICQESTRPQEKHGTSFMDPIFLVGASSHPAII